MKHILVVRCITVMDSWWKIYWFWPNCEVHLGERKERPNCEVLSVTIVYLISHVATIAFLLPLGFRNMNRSIYKIGSRITNHKVIGWSLSWYLLVKVKSWSMWLEFQNPVEAERLGLLWLATKFCINGFLYEMG